MSFVYFKFLFINTIKRKSVWITWILFLFTCTCFIIILPFAATMNTLQVWANTTMSICQTLMGMVAALFTSVLAINIFKDTNDDGTELIIISKPISRFKIVLTKFLLFGFICLLVNITTVLLTCFTAFLPRTEPRFYFGLLVSMFIGNAVTFALFGSISILLTVKFVKVGVIVTNIIISLVFLIYQTLTLFVFSTPAVILDKNSMSASTYILLDRNTETGDYKEQEVVKFEPSAVAEGKEHPCQATNWQEMKEFWEKTIKSKDVTPLLNVTDLASQLSLTYMSYKTDEFAHRQANRLFALTRFYDYQLTTPASPEIIDNNSNKSIDWIYTGYRTIPLPYYGANLYFPSTLGFAGIMPLTGTKLRGYADKIPIGSVKSKDILSAREIFFEPKAWNKYKAGFDVLYDAIFDYRNYTKPSDAYLIVDYPMLFSVGNGNILRYYNLVWGCLMGKARPTAQQQTYEVAQEVWDAYPLSEYDNTSFDITNVNDLNDRFIQFKNYCYWKALAEEQSVLNGETYDGDGSYETIARDEARNETLFGWLSSYLHTSNPFGTWLMRANDDEGLLPINTQTIDINLINLAYEYEKEAISSLSSDEQIDLLTHCALARLEKAASIFKTVCDGSEVYLYVDMTSPNRTAKYSGMMYTVTDNWLPNLHGVLAEYIEQYLGIDINMPLGQNMQYFFYNTVPTTQYWMFGVIWGAISLGLFAAGVVIYNKYDVK